MSEPASPRNLQKLVEEIKTNGFEGVKCPSCDTANLKLKARIDGDADNRHIERSVVCKNCNHVYIHKV
jgi:phage FluMu protein Com